MSIIYNNTIPKPTFPAVKAILQLHDDNTGVVKRTSNSVNFKSTQIGTFSKVVTVSLNVSGVTRIKNLRIGIIRSEPAPPLGSGETNEDGSAQNGNFGIEHSKTFGNKTELTSFFKGLNSTNSPEHENNVKIGTKDDTVSEFVFLNVQVPSEIKRGHVLYKWFFDFY